MVPKKQVDYIVSGFGLAGAVISFKLIQKGYTICIIDPDAPNTSSKIAGGMWNPIVFKRINKCWDADKLIPVALRTYAEIEDFLKEKLMYPNPVIRIFSDHEYANDFYAKSQLEPFKKYINCEVNSEFEKFHQTKFGYGSVHESGRLDVYNVLNYLREFISESHDHLEFQESLDETLLKRTEELVTYKNVESKAIIFCRGHVESDLPLFDYLPLRKTKGEIIDIETKESGFSGIINNSRFIIPISENKKRIGSTYDNHFDHDQPEEKSIGRITEKLENFLGEYKIVKHSAGIRPTVKDRRPVVGPHKDYSNLYIMNGLGTRGVLNAPLCADHLIANLISGTPIPETISSRRFLKD